MTPESLAAQLNELDLQYPPNIPGDLIQAAKDNGLVIVYGESDDLMEFRGAIDEEVGVGDVTIVAIDQQGVIPQFDNLDLDSEADLAAYFRRQNAPKVSITALWHDDGPARWTYELDDAAAPTFNIYEDGETYCLGIVFRLPSSAGGAGSDADASQQLLSTLERISADIQRTPGRAPVYAAAIDTALEQLAQSGFFAEEAQPDPRLVTDNHASAQGQEGGARHD